MMISSAAVNGRAAAERSTGTSGVLCSGVSGVALPPPSAVGSSSSGVGPPAPPPSPSPSVGGSMHSPPAQTMSSGHPVGGLQLATQTGPAQLLVELHDVSAQFAVQVEE